MHDLRSLAVVRVKNNWKSGASLVGHVAIQGTLMRVNFDIR